MCFLVNRLVDNRMVRVSSGNNNKLAHLRLVYICVVCVIQLLITCGFNVALYWWYAVLHALREGKEKKTGLYAYISSFL